MARSGASSQDGFSPVTAAAGAPARSANMCTHTRSWRETADTGRAPSATRPPPHKRRQQRAAVHSLQLQGPDCLHSPQEETGPQAVLSRSSPAGQRESGLSLKSQHLIHLWWAQRGPKVTSKRRRDDRGRDGWRHRLHGHEFE